MTRYGEVSVLVIYKVNPVLRSLVTKGGEEWEKYITLL